MQQIKPIILVTGANGQLGKELQIVAKTQPAFDFRFYTKDSMPIHDHGIVKTIIENVRPNYVINCAAYTAVDKAETEQEIAYKINATAVGELASICQQYHTKFIHISTDYVFDGTSNKPYLETDATSPINTYGASKLKGEELAIATNSNTIIIRTSWVYSAYGHNFVKTMLHLMAQRSEINVVANQIGSPTYAYDLATDILAIIIKDIDATIAWKPGIYNYSNDATISWHQFATEIKNQISSACMVHPIEATAYPTPAKRPNYSVMSKAKFTATFGITMRPWQQSLASCILLLKK
jgi:dTDP-4-dehydrorhamnose reductase